MMRGRRYISTFVLLLFFLFSVITRGQVNDYRKYFTSIKTGDTIALDREHLLETIASFKSKKVIYVISAEDCAICINSIAFWSNYFNKMGVQQLLIIKGASQLLIEKIKMEYNLKINSVSDLYDSFCSTIFKLHSTPVFFILDENNIVLEFDKCGGVTLTPANAKQYFRPQLLLKEEKELVLHYQEHNYLNGMLTDLQFDEQFHSFFAYDDIFNTIIRIDTMGNINGVLKRKGTQAEDIIGLMQIIIPEKRSKDFDFIAFDYNGANEFSWKYFKFHPTNQRGLLTKKVIINNSSEFIDPDEFILLTNTYYSSLTYREKYDSITGIIPIGLIIDKNQDTLLCLPIKSQKINQLYSLCNNPNGLNSVFYTDTHQKLKKFSDDVLGLYNREINKLYLFDSHFSIKDTIELQLDDFINYDCNKQTPHSMIYDLLNYQGNFLVVYQKEVFVSGTNNTMVCKQFYIQLLNKNGKSISSALLLPADIINPQLCIKEKDSLCFVRKNKGEYNLSLYKITLLNN